MRRTIFLILLFLVQLTYGQIKVEKYFEWFNKDHIIQNFSFSQSDSEVVFSKVLKEQCDADPGGIYQATKSNTKRSKRYTDPIVTILNLKTKKTISVDYGWTPSFSKSNDLVLYNFQKNPLFEKRVLAQTLTGNTIKIFNRKTKKSETIASPNKKFLLDPIFLDSNNVIYKLGDAVNGAYEGGVGLSKVNILSMEIRPIYTPKKMFGRPYEVGKIRKFKDSICFIVSVPVDKYSSSRYLLRNQKDIIHDFGVSDFPKEIDSKIAIDKENNLFYLDDDHDLIKDPNFIIKYNSQNKQVFKKIININYHKAFLSPDGEFIFLDNYEGDACLLNVESMKKIQIKLPDSEIHSVIWSKDSKKIAIIQTHETMCKTDKLLLFRIK